MRTFTRPSPTLQVIVGSWAGPKNVANANPHHSIFIIHLKQKRVLSYVNLCGCREGDGEGGEKGGKRGGKGGVEGGEGEEGILI